jgi:hypothetical protein
LTTILHDKIAGLIEVNTPPAPAAGRSASLTTGRRSTGLPAPTASTVANLPGRLSATKLLRVYKQQWIAEQRHRDINQTVKARPIVLHNDDRIAALVSACSGSCSGATSSPLPRPRAHIHPRPNKQARGVNRGNVAGPRMDACGCAGASATGGGSSAA